MEREKIIKTAATLFAESGIRAVSMEQVALELSISKKTLYDDFIDKEHLLQECMDRETARLALSMEYIRVCSKSALEIILLSSINLLNYCSSFCPAFHRDISRFTTIYTRWKSYLQRFQERCMADFLRGVTEKDFLSGQNYELISTMLADQLECPKRKYQPMMVLTLVRGVCTEKGSVKLDKLLEREKGK